MLCDPRSEKTREYVAIVAHELEDLARALPDALDDYVTEATT
jgi:hypothetical protein